MRPEIRQAVREALAAGPSPEPIAVAVSGGGDSTALLVLASSEAEAADVPLHAVTLDHGLRPEAAGEARAVAELCARLGVPHRILRWEESPEGNLQDAARRARYRLISDWAAGEGIARVLLAHTADDNAETFVMGLERAAGLDGLTGMRPSFRRGEVTFLRPLLGARREELRDYLRAESIGWSEDPSNEDRAFTRIRVREALTTLAGLGVEAETLARVMENLRVSRAALDEVVGALCARAVTEDRGDLLIEEAALRAQPLDIHRRLLSMALRWVASRDYPPRAAKLAPLLSGEGDLPRTLHGCLLTREGPTLRIAREPEAAGRSTALADGLWDGRWRLVPTGTFVAPPGAEIRALGKAGLGQCPDWRESGLPRASLLASPSLWAGEHLFSAPLAQYSNGWAARIVASFPPGADSD